MMASNEDFEGGSVETGHDQAATGGGATDHVDNRPVTPKSKKRTSAAQEEMTEVATDDGPESGRKRRRSATETPAKGRKMPISYADADEADKLLWDLRQQGEPWSEVRRQVANLTGVEYGASTLPNRLERLKACFTSVRDQDVSVHDTDLPKLLARDVAHNTAQEAIFLTVKDQVEKDFEKGKWGVIAQTLRDEHGLELYTPDTLEKAFKNLSKRGTASSPSAVAANDQPQHEEDEVHTPTLKGFSRKKAAPTFLRTTLKVEFDDDQEPPETPTPKVAPRNRAATIFSATTVKDEPEDQEATEPAKGKGASKKPAGKKTAA